MKKISVDTIVTVDYILGETAAAVLEGLGDNKFRFTTDAYIDDSDEARRGVFKHLRQAIPARKGKVVQDVKKWPRLRGALQKAGLQPVNIPGGDYPLHYTDEIAVPDFAVSGSHYFVIPRKKIGEYLDLYPIDERGIARRQKLEQAELDKWLESRDPDYIAKNIGDKFWGEFSDFSLSLGGCEFVKITVVDGNGCKKSIIYSTWRTDLIWDRCINVPKIVCEDPDATGIKFLGPKAAAIDPREHHRIKKYYARGWNCDVGYLQPKADLADFIGEGYRWLDLFDCEDGAISHREIADAKRITLEAYSLTDELLPKKLVYSRYTNKVTVA